MKNGKTNSSSRIWKSVAMGVVSMLAVMTLAACSSNNSTSKSGGASSDKVSQSSSVQQNGNVTNTPTTLADFVATVKGAGYEIISGTNVSPSGDGSSISGAVKESDGSFFANVENDGIKGHVTFISGTWEYLSQDSSIQSGASSNIPSASWVKSQEK